MRLRSFTMASALIGLIAAVTRPRVRWRTRWAWLAVSLRYFTMIGAGISRLAIAVARFIKSRPRNELDNRHTRPCGVVCDRHGGGAAEMSYTIEQARAWREAYEAGASLDDLHAKSCATGAKTGLQTIRRAIISVGGKMRGPGGCDAGGGARYTGPYMDARRKGVGA